MADEDETAEAEKSPYLVVGHGCVSPALSVFKVEPYSDSAAASIPRRVARLKCKPDMCFVPFRGKDRRWIVGVGGSSDTDYGAAPGTIIFDIKKQSVIRGPEPQSIKSYPALLTVNDKIYALTRTPSVEGPLNFLPWFEVLDLSEAQEVDGRLTNCKWRPLKRPPYFPWELTPGQYVWPPRVTVRVRSYVVVGFLILVSVIGQAATYAFHTNSNRWSIVDDKKSLPFVEGAIPHSPGLFLGLSRIRKAITGYKINAAEGARSLSVVAIPVVSDLESGERIARSYKFLSLGIDRGFCLMSCWSVDKTRDAYAHYLRAHIRVRTYMTEDFVESEGKFLVVSKQRMQVYKIRDLI